MNNTFLKKTALIKASIFGALVFSAQLAFAVPAGSVTFKSGDATITHADNIVVPAEKSASLNEGDIIQTKNGRVQLAFIDGGKVSLQPNTIYKINKFAFSGKEDGTEYNFTELVKGGLRTISGLIGHKNRDHYQLKTAVATIGIRGTEYTAFFGSALTMTTNHGSVDVCSLAGECLNAITGQTILVAAGNIPVYTDKQVSISASKPTVAKLESSANKSSNENSSKTVFAEGDLIYDSVLAQAESQTETPTNAVAVQAQAQAASDLAAAQATALAQASVNAATDAATADEAAQAAAAQALAAQTAAAQAATAQTAADQVAAAAQAAVAQAAANQAAAAQAAANQAAAVAQAAAAQAAAAQAAATQAAADQAAAAQVAAAQAAAAQTAAVQAAAAQAAAAQAAALAGANSATIVSLATMASGSDNNGVYKGTTTFKGNAGSGNPNSGNSPNGNALKQYIDNSNTPNIVTGTTQEASNDGIVRWGRAAGGTYNNQSMLMTNWVTGIATPLPVLANLIGTYVVTNSTAPYIVKNGNITAVGASDSVRGSLNVNFMLSTFGYGLIIPVPGKATNLTILGGGLLTASSATFKDSIHSITSTACGGGCTGLLYGGSAVEGSLFGANAERAGLQYGVNIPGSGGSGGGGNLYGGAVLTKQ